MKLWNLSSFGDLEPQVWSRSEAKESSTGDSRRFVRRARQQALSSFGASVLLLALSNTLVHMNVSVSDHSLRLVTDRVTSNVVEDRPPLHLLFGGRHPLKWDAAHEAAMLERAVAALASANDNNRFNVVNAALTEALPSAREDAFELSSLGVKKG